jgi:hypothetical protein
MKNKEQLRRGCSWIILRRYSDIIVAILRKTMKLLGLESPFPAEIQLITIRIQGFTPTTFNKAEHIGFV